MLRQNVVVTVSNITSNAVVISPKSVIGELQSVTSLLRKVQSLKLMCCRKFILTDSTGLQREGLFDLLRKHQDSFSTGDTDIGNCTGMKHRIVLTNTIPFKKRHRRIPPSMVEEVRKLVSGLVASGIIRKSMSPWASAGY